MVLIFLHHNNSPEEATNKLYWFDCASTFRTVTAIAFPSAGISPKYPANSRFPRGELRILAIRMFVYTKAL